MHASTGCLLPRKALEGSLRGLGFQPHAPSRPHREDLVVSLLLPAASYTLLSTSPRGTLSQEPGAHQKLTSGRKVKHTKEIGVSTRFQLCST